MALLVETITVVVQNEHLRLRYPGGVEGLRRDCPEETFATDGLVSGVGVSGARELRHVKRLLQQQGFVPLVDDRFVDFAIVHPRLGPTRPCDWLGFLQNEDGRAVAYRIDTDPHRLVAIPAGWAGNRAGNDELGRSNSYERDFSYLRREAGLDVFVASRTGQLVYVDPEKRDGKLVN